MEQMSVTQFAGELKMPAAVLLEQLKRAGVDKSGAADLLTEQDKAKLLEYLRRSHGDTQPKGKITLTRKQTTEIRATDSTGRARTVQVEVRKKRTFVKRDELAEQGAAAEAVPVEELAAAVEVPAPVLETPVAEAPAIEAVAAAEPVAPEIVPEVVAAEPVVPEVVEAPAPAVAEETAAEPTATAAAEPSAAGDKSAPSGRAGRPGRQEPAPQVTTVLSKPLPLSEILSEEEIAARKRDEDRQRALKERQAADLRARQEREAAARTAAEARKAEEEARLRAEQQKKEEPAKPAKPTTGTLHRPAKTVDKPARRD